MDLSDYIPKGDPVINVDKWDTYSIQYYEDEHEDEYTVMELENDVPNGNAQLFKNGVIQLSWSMSDGKRDGSFTLYLDGQAYCSSTWKYLEESKRTGFVKSIYNDPSGQLLLMENVVETGIITFKGGYDKNQKREGFGIEYDERTGLPLRCGYYIGEKLFHLSAEFQHSNTASKSSSFVKCTESVMIEYGGSENADNVSDLTARYPVYIGDYEYDDLGFRFIRVGSGRTIHSKTGISDSVIGLFGNNQTSTLYQGWYYRGIGDKSLRSFAISESNVPASSRKHGSSSTTNSTSAATASTSASASATTATSKITLCSGLSLDVDQMIEEFTSSDFYYNTLFTDALKSTLTFNNLPCLKSIKIGNYSFQGIRSFVVSRLPNLQRIQIGSQCCRYFNEAKKYKFERSDGNFIVTDCRSLSSITIGNDSFCDYNYLKLTGLDSLAVLNFGDNCFWCVNLNLSSRILRAKHCME